MRQQSGECWSAFPLPKFLLGVRLKSAETARRTIQRSMREHMKPIICEYRSKLARDDMVMKSSIVAKHAGLVLSILTGGLLGYFGICNALASHYLELNTQNSLERATALEPSNALNRLSLGRYWEFNIENTDLDRAISAYRRASELNPRSAAVWLGLASAYESKNDIDAARRAYLNAKRFYPASADASWRYGNFLLRQGEQREGFLEIHRAVETDPKRGWEAFLICRHFDPDLESILTRVVPPIASIYSDIIWQLTGEGRPDQGLKVWSKLVALHPNLESREVFFFVDGLLINKQSSEAKLAWEQATALMKLPKLEDAPGSLIWDGGFETDVIGGGLAWRIQPSSKVTIGHDHNVRHSGRRALRIDFAVRENSNFMGVCQRVVVEPNTRYELSAWLRTREMAQGRGIFLQVAEPGMPWNPNVKTPEQAGTTDWTKVWTRWISPNNSRLAEVCVSRLNGFESNRAPVTAWVDDVSLLKLE